MDGGFIMKFCWITLMVKNVEDSIEFYREIVGLEIDRRFKAGLDMDIVFLGDGETKVELICDKNKEVIDAGQDMSLGFIVDSVEEMITFLKKREINILSGPFQPNPHSKYFFILDPNGYKIQFFENVKSI